MRGKGGRPKKGDNRRNAHPRYLYEHGIKSYQLGCRCPVCIEAIHAATSRYRLKHPDKVRSNHRRWAAQHKDEISLRSRSRRYGLTPTQWLALFDAQGRRCACCLATTPRGRRGWCTEHDHVTGLVRGITCGQCNTGIGLLGDNLAGVENARLYLDPELPRVDEHY